LADASENPSLQFWHWFNFTDNDDDWGRVQIKAIDDVAWTDISGSYNDNSHVWTFAYIDLIDYAGQTVQIAFFVHSDNATSESGWYIDDVSILDNSGLSVDAGPDKTILSGFLTTLNATVSGGTEPYTYEWVPAEGLDDPAVLNPVASPSDTTTYTLKVTDSKGCFRTDRVTVFVEFTGSNQTNILSYSLGIPPQTGEAVIDQGSHTVNIEVDYGSDVTAMVATFTLSDGATAKIGGVDQESGVTANDFSDPLTYTVTAENGVSTQDWIVTVAVALNDKTDILRYNLGGIPPQTGEAIIDPVSHTVNIEVESGTDLTDLIATFVLSDGAIASVGGIEQQSEVTANDFSNPLTYTITAEDGATTQDWLVTVDAVTGLKEIYLGEINVYPNPFSDNITIEFSNPDNIDIKLSVFNISGNKVFELDNIISDKVVFKTDYLPKGVYIVEFQGEMIWENKIIIKYR
jgi:hypothetical protein